MDPRRLIPALVLVAAVSVLVTGGVVAARGLLDRPDEVAGAQAPVAEAQGADGGAPRAATVLAQWDARRAAAWSEGDAQALGDLYAAGSKAGRADVALLDAYVDRDLTVDGMQMQLLSLQVLAHDDVLLDMVVTDRLFGATAIGPAGERLLPVDRASTRRIVMVREGDQWLVRDVTPQERAAASTSPTSSSKKS